MSWEGDRTATDYLTTPDNAIWDFGTTTDFTISMWLKRITDEGVDEYLMGRGIGANGILLWIRANDTFRLNVAGSGGLTGDAITVDGNWHHLAVTVDRDGTMDFYLDTVLDSNAGTLNGNVSNSSPLILNDWTTAGGLHASVRYEDVGIYSGVLLTAAQIASIYNARLRLLFFPNGLVSYWPMHVPGDGVYHAAVNGDLGLTDQSLNSSDFTVGTGGIWSQDSPGLHWPSNVITVPAVAAAPAVTRVPRPGMMIQPGLAV